MNCEKTLPVTGTARSAAVVLRQYSDRPANLVTDQPRRGLNEVFGLPMVTTRLRRKRDSALAYGGLAQANDLALALVAEALWARHPAAARLVEPVDAAAGPGHCTRARLDGPEGNCDRDAHQGTSVGATDPNQHSVREWRHTTHRSTELVGTTRQRRRRRCRHRAHPRTSPARGETNVWSPKWFAKNVRHDCDRVVGRPRR